MSNTTRVTISNGARGLLEVMAEEAGVTPRQYLEALLHYAGSIYNRPGSWEANTPFSIETYEPRDGSYADRWFE
ncbi:MAG: hypothetical protein AzoDbin1_02128 [Azoarcus sp.]|nr:hypothetical protein [Azoarcus sp.]